MARYLLGRLVVSSISLVLVVVIVFVAVRLMPGDIVDQFFQDTGARPGQAEALREKLGLSDPIPVQFARYLGELARGDLGESLASGRELSVVIRDRTPVTFQLAMMTLIFSLAIGLPLGVLSAVMRGSALDYLLRTIAIGGISIPFFWIAVLTISLPAYYWRWTPPIGHVPLQEDPLASIQHMLAPALVGTVFLAGSIMRMLRATMLEVLRLDYMRTAAAKGLSMATQIRRHALRNALIPVVTLIGIRFIFLLSGSVVLESIYALPGLGQLSLDALSRRDYQVVQAVTLFMAVIIIMTNLVVDISYGFIDPRIRHSRA